MAVRVDQAGDRRERETHARTIPHGPTRGAAPAERRSGERQDDIPTLTDVRIGIVSDYYYPQLGGITEHVHGQATELTRRGHEVTVVTPRLAVTPRTVDGDDLPARSFDVVKVGRAYRST